MNVREAAEILKDAIPAREVAAMYGYKPGRGDVIVCPFHGDRDASLHLYPGNRGWCCFGCHKGGSVIDWVMLMEDVSFAEAVRILDTRAGTGLLDKVELDNTRRLRRSKVEAVKEALDHAWQVVFDEASKEAHLLTRATAELLAVPREMWSGRDWMFWGSANERLQELDGIIREIHHNREEVKDWHPIANSQNRETTPSSQARPSTPSPALSRMREKLNDAQNKLAGAG